MRNLLVVIVFFFGPALVMLMLRSLLPLLAAWLRARSKARQVIDVTPRKRALPRWFWPLALVLGAASAALAWQSLRGADAPAARHYVPAHMDESGYVVPGHWAEGPAAGGSAPRLKSPGGEPSRSEKNGRESGG